MIALHAHTDIDAAATERRRSREEGHGGGIPWLGPLLVLVPLVFALCFVWLRSQGEDLNRRIDEMRTVYAKEEKKLANLRLQHEVYTDGNYILPEARKLGLHPPLPRQVYRMPSQPGMPFETGEGVSLFAER